jgi:hypothetical protein
MATVLVLMIELLSMPLKWTQVAMVNQTTYICHCIGTMHSQLNLTNKAL